MLLVDAVAVSKVLGVFGVFPGGLNNSGCG